MTKLANSEADPISSLNVAIYQQGGVAAGNLYTSFDDAYDAVTAAGGTGTIVIDASIAPCVTGTATYALGGITLWAVSAMTLLTVVEGATITTLPTIHNSLVLACDATTVPCQITAGVALMVCDIFTQIKSNGGKSPLIEVSNAATLYLFMRAGSTIKDGGAEVLGLLNTATANIYLVSGEAKVEDETIKGAAGMTINANVNTDGGVLGTTHTNFTGTWNANTPGDGATARGLNTTHRGSTGSGDHSDIGDNTTAIGLNTTHRGSVGGGDHSDVASNNGHRGGNGSDHANVATNTAHIGYLVTGTNNPHGMPKCNYGASASPGTGNDQTEGYSAGSLWVKTNATTECWICTDASTGAAAWLQLA